MTMSMYRASVPIFLQMLPAPSSVLDKAAAHAAAKKIDPQVFIEARLYPDMFPLNRQIMIATDFAKGACARLAGVEPPKYPDTEKNFVELKAECFLNSQDSGLEIADDTKCDVATQRPDMIAIRRGAVTDIEGHGAESLWSGLRLRSCTCSDDDCQ